MKNLILFFAIVLNFLMVSAQTSKGSIIVGGNVNIRSYKNTVTDPLNNPNSISRENKSSNFGFYPGAGYFIMDKFAVGLSFGLNNSQLNYKTPSGGGFDEYTSKNSNTTINLFARKYFLNEKGFGLYVGLNVGAGPSKGSYTNSYFNGQETSSKSTGTNINTGLDFGLAYFPTPKIGLQAGIAGLGMSKSKGKTTNSNSTNEAKYDTTNFNFDINSLAFSIGVYYIFSCKK